MRITINYFEGYPELEAELTKYSPRARAERLRFLAALGLSFLHDGRPARVVPLPNAEVSSPPASAPADETTGGGAGAARRITKNVFDQA